MYNYRGLFQWIKAYLYNILTIENHAYEAQVLWYNTVMYYITCRLNLQCNSNFIYVFFFSINSFTISFYLQGRYEPLIIF